MDGNDYGNGVSLLVGVNFLLVGVKVFLKFLSKLEANFDSLGPIRNLKKYFFFQIYLFIIWIFGIWISALILYQDKKVFLNSLNGTWSE